MIHALHGALGHHSDWKVIAAALADFDHSLRGMDLWRFLDCCRLDLRATGEAIANEVDAQSSPPHILLGYSMGARLALHALLARPKMWSAAILIAPHTGLTQVEERSARRSSDAIWASKALTQDWDDFLSDWNEQSILSDSETPNRQFLRQRRQAIALSFTSWGLGDQEDLLPRLDQITCPVLWVTGEQDQKFCRIATAAQQRNQLIQRLTIRQGGHRLIFSHPQEIARASHEFLKSTL